MVFPKTKLVFVKDFVFEKGSDLLYFNFSGSLSNTLGSEIDL